MSFRMRSVLRLSVAVCGLLLVAGGRADAAALPKLSGAYAIQIHKYCQSSLLAQVKVIRGTTTTTFSCLTPSGR
jgi:hypothetical protein